MRSEVVRVEMCRDHGCGKYAHVDGNASGLLAKLLPDMKVGETRNVKVTVEVVETPRERLKREVDDVVHKYRDKVFGPDVTVGMLVKIVNDHIKADGEAE